MKAAAGQIDVELSIFALQRERSPQSGSLEAPEGILFADSAVLITGLAKLESAPRCVAGSFP